MGTLSVPSRQRGRAMELQMNVPVLESSSRNKCKLIWDSSTVSSIHKKMPKGAAVHKPAVSQVKMSLTPAVATPRRNSIVSERISFYEVRDVRKEEGWEVSEDMVTLGSAEDVNRVAHDSVPSDHVRTSSGVPYSHSSPHVSHHTTGVPSHHPTHIVSQQSSHLHQPMSHHLPSNSSHCHVTKMLHKPSPVIVPQPLKPSPHPVSHLSSHIHTSQKSSIFGEFDNAKKVKETNSNRKQTRIKPRVTFQDEVIEDRSNNSPQMKAKISFAENETTTFEYDDEESALAQYLRDHPEEEEEARQQQEEVERAEQDTSADDLLTDSPRNQEADPSAMKSNTVIGMPTGALSSYKSKIQVPDFQFGMSTEPEDYYTRQAEPEPESEEGRDLLPADDSQLDTFSSEVSKADMLF